jgi:hypothetical protein
MVIHYHDHYYNKGFSLFFQDAKKLTFGGSYINYFKIFCVALDSFCSFLIF